jgi:hypothetical protein
MLNLLKFELFYNKLMEIYVPLQRFCGVRTLWILPNYGYISNYT